MGPILPADMLDASGKKERRAKRLTFIECHAKKKKNLDFRLLLEKQRSVFHAHPPTPWVLSLTRPASAGAPVESTRALQLVTVPVGAPDSPATRQRHPSRVCVFCGRENFSVLRALLKAGTYQTEQESPVF